MNSIQTVSKQASRQASDRDNLSIIVGHGVFWGKARDEDRALYIFIAIQKSGFTICQLNL